MTLLPPATSRASTRAADLAPHTRVVIVHYGDIGLTQRAVASVLAGSLQPGLIVVVDNGPGEYPEADGDRGQRLLVLRQGRNAGFAGGVNAGLAALPDDPEGLVWLLNNDAVATTTALEELLATVGRLPGRALVSSLVLDDATGEPWFERPRYLPWRLESRHSRHSQAILGVDADVDVGSAASWRSMPYLPGCSLLIPGRVLVALGGLDRSFFMYGEDVDFAMRAARMGCALVLSQRSVVRHRAGSAARPAVRERFLAESAFRLTARYHAWLLPVAVVAGLATGVKRLATTRELWWLTARIRGYAAAIVH